MYVSCEDIGFPSEILPFPVVFPVVCPVVFPVSVLFPDPSQKI